MGNKMIVLGLILCSVVLLQSCRKKISVQKPTGGKPYILELSPDTELIQQKVTLHSKPADFTGSIPPNHTNFNLRIMQGIAITVVTDFGGWCSIP